MSNGIGSSTISFRRIIPLTLAIFLLVLPLLLTVTNPVQFQQSDFVSAFYLAGRLVLTGRPLELYADQSSTSLMATPFNAYAHQTLSQFPQAATAVYMYPPLTAAVFAPLATLTPTMAMLVWQIISIVAFGACAYLLSRMSGRRWDGLFFGGVLFLPVAQNLLLGQLGLVLGLLPISLGYWLLLKGRPLWAGLSWSLLCLKPQFLPVVVLIVMSLALANKWRCAMGFLLGAAVLEAGSFIGFGPEVFRNWFMTLKMAGTIYSDPQYSTPSHLVSSLTPAVVHALPLEWRAMAKPVFYAVGAIVGAHLLWFCRGMIKRAGTEYISAIPFVVVLSITVMPLVLPYLLFYDLSIFAIAGMIIFCHEAMRKERALIRDLTLAWIFIDVYLVVFMFVGPQFVQSLLLVLVLALIYKRAFSVASSWARSH